MNPLLLQLSESVNEAETLEDLTRQLLEMLVAITGLESAYLTTIDLSQGLQHIQFSRNTGHLVIPEGLSVPWEDTLCKRSLDEGRQFTDNVSDCWGDSDAARELGIRTYLSVPIHTATGDLHGTLCAASSDQKSVDVGTDRIVAFFAKLIAQHIQRESLLDELKQRNTDLAVMALTDVLTGLPNRRALMNELQRMFAAAQRAGQYVLLGFVDLDHFKQINDNYGHEAGDAVLRQIATQLLQAVRAGDLLARIGGDEFVAVGLGPHLGESVDDALGTFKSRLFDVTRASITTTNATFDYAGASVGAIAVDPAFRNPWDALSEADAAMYKVKQARRLPAPANP
ncbi:sensor domain-containing diguanylate cyclase [Silvimonas sp.]|uniref:sensor domain-containing diguanylate cyclase n=1 Tax=Silvimonas sp. TaxID=2650811 RepID=UPI002851DD14|nr:sensor domain-containing diguanylate cyclase [Silvimonas sp.]MDR3427480.1 sensor domain-containing diguanylate cyclase [Silvimonas sp.]